MHCYYLPRLSEDLDFVDLKKKIDIPELAEDLERYFKKNTDLKVKAVSQKFRIYLKFPVLHELGLASISRLNFSNLRSSSRRNKRGEKIDIFGSYYSPIL